MKKIIASLIIFAAAVFVTLPFPTDAVAQSQGASAERPKAAPTRVKVQRRSNRYVDTSCHTYGGYGWGPYWGPCPYRGEVYAAQPSPPVFGPFLPFGPFW
ncbi:MAG: hypothetical protein ABUL48_00915 [Pseudorhodoplanes sp.]